MEISEKERKLKICVSLPFLLSSQPEGKGAAPFLGNPGSSGSQNLGTEDWEAKSLHQIKSWVWDERREEIRECVWAETQKSSEEFARAKEILP